MTDAPERKWFIAEGVYDDENPPKMVEYIRADLARPMTVADAANVLLDELSVIEPVDGPARVAVLTWLTNRALSKP